MQRSADHKLIQACKKGSQKAQNELFRRFSGVVMAISRRYCPNSLNPEDLFQESFIEIFRSFSRSKTEIENLDHWVGKIAINTCIKQLDKGKKISYLSYEPSHLDEGHKLIIDALSNEELLTVIGSLPEGYRMVFNLYFIDGYQHKEIADMLDISESTSRSQLAKAKNLLRKKLETIGIYHYEVS